MHRAGAASESAFHCGHGKGSDQMAQDRAGTVPGGRTGQASHDRCHGDAHRDPQAPSETLEIHAPADHSPGDCICDDIEAQQ